jgi:hypothetical protein
MELSLILTVIGFLGIAGVISFIIMNSSSSEKRDNPLYLPTTDKRNPVNRPESIDLI